MAALVHTLDEHGDRNPERTACVIGADRCGYGDLADRVRRLAAGLRATGLRPGDRVSLFLPNCVDYVVAFYGVMRAGLVANPINGVLTPSEVSYLLADSGAAALITTAEQHERLAEVLAAGPPPTVVIAGPGRPDGTLALTELLAHDGPPPDFPDPESPACLPYSSGTTGRAKGIVHSHHSLAMQAVLSANHLQLRADDVLVQALPLVHLYPGNIIMGGLLVAGATMVVQPRFDPPSFLPLLQTHGATACAGVPTTYAMLCQLPESAFAEVDLSRMQIGFSAGAPLASDIRTRFGALTGVRVLDCYGITEAAGNLTATLRYGQTPELSCGVPYPMTEIRIVDEADNELPAGEVGELIARGPQIMGSYWQRPDASAVTLRGGWLHTGDLARRDERGFYYIVDRKKDLILSGGYNVYPAEIEEVLQSHPGVAMCAVFAVPDELKGEKPWAAVVPATGGVLDPQQLGDWCRERLAAYKVPRRFVVVGDLPRSSVGKILRRELRARYADEVVPAPSPS